ncbi:MAG: hydrogenase formation protein HypD [Candidatus Omnitrophica bacterium]|nr:hydrogenase formation protein HypD [Candidatus Omnitrophota bacterium]
MKYVDEFRNKNLANKISQKIHSLAHSESLRIMEVCGSHTQSFHRFGLGKLLPPSIKFISGPGCPVCVSSPGYIDAAIALAQDKNNIILSFGDMLRVPGSKSTLEMARVAGAQVGVVYSALEAISVAFQNPKKKVIFLAVGFETTVPTVGLTVLDAKRKGLRNIFFYCAFKLIPPALEYLAKDCDLNISGFLLPGHVSAIIGTKPYAFIAKRYKIGCCVAGFEPLDMLEGIYFLLQQRIKKRPKVENQYNRAVRSLGNLKAKKIISSVFEPTVANWRGLGSIAQSGLRLRKEFSRLDAVREFGFKAENKSSGIKDTRCRCREVIRGIEEPRDCLLFKKICSPEHPYGPCMISSEGTCNVYYRYC